MLTQSVVFTIQKRNWKFMHVILRRHGCAHMANWVTSDRLQRLVGRFSENGMQPPHIALNSLWALEIYSVSAIHRTCVGQSVRCHSYSNCQLAPVISPKCRWVLENVQIHVCSIQHIERISKTSRISPSCSLNLTLVVLLIFHSKNV
jgi:hypothetical protein